MMRFLREHAEMMTGILVILTLLLGGTLLYLRLHGDAVKVVVETTYTPAPPVETVIISSPPVAQTKNVDEAEKPASTDVAE